MNLTKLIDLSSIVEKFAQYTFKIVNETIVYDNDDTKNHEIELIYTFPDLKLLSNLNMNKDNVINRNYIEFIRKFKELPKKYRKQFDFKHGNYEINNNSLYNQINTLWECKETLDEQMVVDIDNKKKIIMKYAIEQPSITELKYINEDKTRLEFVHSSKVIVDNIKIEFKTKHNLGPATNMKTLSSFFNAVDAMYKYTSYSIEWEIIDSSIYKYNEIDAAKHGSKKKSNELYNNLYCNLKKAFSISFMYSDISKLYLSPMVLKFNNIFTKFKSFENFNELIVEEYVLTKKYNGRKIVFYVKDKQCYLNIYDMVYLCSCNILDGNILYGEGEIIKKNSKLLIYPYYFDNINNQKYSRLDSIDLYNKLIDNSVNTDTIIFKEKNYTGPYDSINNLLYGIVKYENTIHDPDIDGIILMNINDTFNYVDYKFKLDNTIDIIFQLQLSKSACYDSPRGLMIKLIGHQYDGKNFVEFDTVDIYYDDKVMKFNTDLLLLEYMDPFTNTITYIPTIFIGEYSIITKTIIPRLEKTNNFYRYYYKGNNIDIVNKSRSFHDKFSIFNLDVLKNYINNNTIIKNVNVDHDRLLNKKKITYFKKNNLKKIKTGLNIISNIAKTQAISITGSKLTNKYRKISKVLVIDIGQGGDLHKYYYIGIKKMIGTDPDPNGITETNNRYNKLLGERKKHSNVYTLKTYTMSILNKEYLSTINDKFDLIDWQFAIHYSYCDSYKDYILKLLRKMINPKGKIIISCLDGDKIEQEFIKQNTNKLSFEIEKNVYYIIEKKNDNIITISYESSMQNGKDEFLIKNTIFEDFKKYKFKLIDQIYFIDLITDEHILLYKTLSNFPRLSTYQFYKNIISKLDVLQNKNLMKLISFFNMLIFQSEL
jgi:hypothetical protein